MGAVFIRCPTTGWPVSTGIETEASVFRYLPVVGSRMRCPLCGKEHHWTVKTAWLADRPAPTAAKTQREPA